MKINLSINEVESFIEFTALELSIEKNSISIETYFRDIPTWNSLNALIYISRINEETGIQITSGDLSKLVKLQDIYYLIKSQNNGNN
jgi:acyl carrier protein